MKAQHTEFALLNLLPPGYGLLLRTSFDPVGAVALTRKHVRDSRDLSADEVANETKFLLTSDGEASGHVANGAVVFRQQKTARS